MTKPKLEVGRLVMYRTKTNKEQYCLGLVTELSEKGFIVDWFYTTPGYITVGLDKRPGPDTFVLESWAEMYDEYINHMLNIEENK